MRAFAARDSYVHHSRNTVNPMTTDVATTPVLFVGVISYNQSGHLERRHSIRALHRPDPAVELRFVMAEDEAQEDVSLGDVLLLPLPPRVNRRLVGQWLLKNAFLRYATAVRPSVRFIAKADDDTAFNATALALELSTLPPTMRHVVYGPVNVWFVYAPLALTPVCWDSSPRRWAGARAQWVAAGRPHDTTDAPLDQCLRVGTVGPFPFAGGPFQAYSHAYAARLVAMLHAEEEYVLTNFSTAPIIHPRSGAVVQPTSKAHPANRLLIEDAHFGYMQRVGFDELDVVMIDASMCSMVGRDKRNRWAGDQMCGGPLWRKELKGAADGRPPAMIHAHIYHNIKHPERWSYLKRHPELLERSARPRLVCDEEEHSLGATMHAQQGCCRRWRSCRFVQLP